LSLFLRFFFAETGVSEAAALTAFSVIKKKRSQINTLLFFTAAFKM